jgi:hypothetical protein
VGGGEREHRRVGHIRARGPGRRRRDLQRPERAGEGRAELAVLLAGLVRPPAGEQPAAPARDARLVAGAPGLEEPRQHREIEGGEGVREEAEHPVAGVVLAGDPTGGHRLLEPL